jgi:hypothetical protein
MYDLYDGHQRRTDHFSPLTHGFFHAGGKMISLKRKNVIGFYRKNGKIRPISARSGKARIPAPTKPLRERLRFFTTREYIRSKNAIKPTLVVTTEDKVVSQVKKALAGGKDVEWHGVVLDPDEYNEIRRLRADIKDLERTVELTGREDVKETIARERVQLGELEALWIPKWEKFLLETQGGARSP